MGKEQNKCKCICICKTDIKSIEGGMSNREEGQDWSKFFFCSKRCSRRFEWL